MVILEATGTAVELEIQTSSTAWAVVPIDCAVDALRGLLIAKPPIAESTHRRLFALRRELRNEFEREGGRYYSGGRA